MFFGVVIVLSLIFLCNSTTSIPSYIKVCKRNDPQVSKCIQESVELLRPRLAKGIKELDVPAIEPFKVPDINVGGIPGFSIILKNVSLSGASNFQINKIKANIPNLSFRLEITFPFAQLSGLFNIDIQLMSVPIKGEGNFAANATHILASGVLKANETKNNGDTILNFTKLDLKLQIAEYHIRLESGPNTDAELIETANVLLNQNKKELLGVITPILESRISEMILEIANDITKNFKYDEVFPAK